MSLKAKIKNIIRDKMRCTVVVEIKDSLTDEVLYNNWNIPINLDSKKTKENQIKDRINSTLEMLSEQKEKSERFNLSDSEAEKLINTEIQYSPSPINIEREKINEKLILARGFLNSLDFSKIDLGNKTVLENILKNIFTLMRINYRE
jgi:hypothetical protein